MHRRMFLSLVVTLVLAALAAGPATVAAQAPTNVTLLSAPFGTGTYVFGATIEEIFKKKHPWLRVVHRETPGFVFNIKKLAGEPQIARDTIIGTGKVLLWAAEKGQKPFTAPITAVKVKALANEFVLGTWLVTLNPALKGGKDLEGKKVALGGAAQINWAVEPEYLLRVGWGLGKGVSIQYLALKQAASALLDGAVDASVVGAYANPISHDIALNPAGIELFSSPRTFHHLSWGEAAVKKVVQETGMPLLPFTLPAGKVKGQTAPLAVFLDTATWGVAENFPENLAYEFTKTLIANTRDFGERHALGKLLTAEALLWGWEAGELHPGAVRAYREAGLLK